MAEDYQFKADIMQTVASAFSVDTERTNAALRQELTLQVKKLKDLSKAFEKKSSKLIRDGMPYQKLRRKMAGDQHRLAMQSELIDETVARMLENIYIRENPNAKPVVRKNYKMKCRQFTAKINRLIQNESAKMQKQMFDRVRNVLGGG